MTREEAIKLVTSEYDGLNRVDKKYKNDYEIVKKAVSFWSYQIKYASSYLKANKEIGLIVVKEDGQLIGELEYNLKNDNDVILEALKQDGLAIGYICKYLADSSEYIDVAIKSNPLSIRYFNLNKISLEQAKYCISLEPSLISYFRRNSKFYLELIKIVDKIDENVYMNLDDSDLYEKSHFTKDPFSDFGSQVVLSDDDLPF